MAREIGLASLTQRELEVLRAKAGGSTDKVAAEALGMRLGTIKTHEARIRLKLDRRSTMACVLLAERAGVL